MPRVTYTGRGCVSGSSDKTRKPLSGSVASVEATKTTTVTPKGKFSSRVSFPSTNERGHELPSPTTSFSSTRLIFEQLSFFKLTHDNSVSFDVQFIQLQDLIRLINLSSLLNGYWNIYPLQDLFAIERINLTDFKLT